MRPHLAEFARVLAVHPNRRRSMRRPKPDRRGRWQRVRSIDSFSQPIALSVSPISNKSDTDPIEPVGEHRFAGTYAPRVREASCEPETARRREGILGKAKFRMRRREARVELDRRLECRQRPRVLAAAPARRAPYVMAQASREFISIARPAASSARRTCRSGSSLQRQRTSETCVCARPASASALRPSMSERTLEETRAPWRDFAPCADDKERQNLGSSNRRIRRAGAHDRPLRASMLSTTARSIARAMRADNSLSKANMRRQIAIKRSTQTARRFRHPIIWATTRMSSAELPDTAANDIAHAGLMATLRVGQRSSSQMNLARRGRFELWLAGRRIQPPRNAQIRDRLRDRRREDENDVPRSRRAGIGQPAYMVSRDENLYPAPRTVRIMRGFFGWRSILPRSLRNQIVNAAVKGVGATAADRVEQLVSRQNLARTTRERHQDRELARGLSLISRPPHRKANGRQHRASCR